MEISFDPKKDVTNQSKQIIGSSNAMPKTLKTKSGRTIRLNSSAEETAIARGIALDSDARSFTDKEWKAVKPLVRMGRPPKQTPVKVSTTIRFDADVLAALKATGPGWQTRVNKAMKEWVKRHPAN